MDQPRDNYAAVPWGSSMYLEAMVDTGDPPGFSIYIERCDNVLAGPGSGTKPGEN